MKSVSVSTATKIFPYVHKILINTTVQNKTASGPVSGFVNGRSGETMPSIVPTRRLRMMLGKRGTLSTGRNIERPIQIKSCAIACLNGSVIADGEGRRADSP